MGPPRVTGPRSQSIVGERRLSTCAPAGGWIHGHERTTGIPETHRMSGDSGFTGISADRDVWLGTIDLPEDPAATPITPGDDADIEDFGREISYAVMNEYVSLFFPDINSSTMVSFLEIWFKRFQSYHHRVDDQNNRHSFSLNHDINLNFSKALKVILERLVEPIIKSPLIFGEPASSSITFTFHVTSAP